MSVAPSKAVDWSARTSIGLLKLAARAILAASHPAGWGDGTGGARRAGGGDSIPGEARIADGLVGGLEAVTDGASRVGAQPHHHVSSGRGHRRRDRRARV